MSDLLSEISPGKMSHQERERFQDMCLKLAGKPSNPSGTGEVRCKLNGRELSVKDDYSKAYVQTSDVETNPDQIQGVVEDVEKVHMSMLGDNDQDETVAKTIVVEGDEGELRLTNHESPAEGGKPFPNRGR